MYNSLIRFERSCNVTPFTDTMLPVPTVVFRMLTSVFSVVSVAETAPIAVDSVFTVVESAFVPTTADNDAKLDCVAFVACVAMTALTSDWLALVPRAVVMEPVAVTLFVSTAAISASVSSAGSAPFTNIDIWAFRYEVVAFNAIWPDSA